MGIFDAQQQDRTMNQTDSKRQGFLLMAEAVANPKGQGIHHTLVRAVSNYWNQQ